ncbi:MAG: hypothetical protein QM756_30315 [Polyangiaceae bacterium]
MHRFRFAWLVGAGACLLSSPSLARVEAQSGYSKPQTFSCALRLLRVDRGYDVVEKDQDAAYVLFRYPLAGSKEQASGSLEIVETAAGVRVFVQLPRLPEYHEALLRDALLKKLREEYGPPPAKSPPPKPAPPAEKPSPPSAAPEPSKPDDS